MVERFDLIEESTDFVILTEFNYHSELLREYIGLIKISKIRDLTEEERNLKYELNDELEREENRLKWKMNE